MSGSSKKRRALLTAILFVVVLAMGYGAYSLNAQQGQLHNQTNTDQPASDPCGSFPAEGNNGIGATLVDGLRVGVSDGTIPLDLHRSSIAFKCDGAKEFLLCQQKPQSPDCTKAMADFTQEVSHVSDDAESLIYRQNVYLFALGNFTRTIIVGVSFSNQYLISSRYLLQGVYVAQEEYNRTHPNQLRVLVANFGDTIDTATQALQQIVRAIKADRSMDHSIVGIVNIPFISTAEADQSSSFQSALELLSAQNVPVVFPNGASGSQSEQMLSHIMFHIGVPAWREGSADAIFARKYLSTNNLVVYTDTTDSYSNNLACSFLSQWLNYNSRSTPCKEQDTFKACLSSSVHCITYKAGDANSLTSSVAQVLGLNPSLIYLACDAADAKTLMDAMIADPQFQTHQGMRILGSDALYQGQFTGDEYATMAFSAFAFPDEWTDQGLQQAPFVDEYGIDFEGWPPYLRYGFVRPNSAATMAYDATSVFTQSMDDITANNEQNPNITVNNVLPVIQQQGFQGFSGYIHFDIQGNPINKAIVFLIVGDTGSDRGKAHMQKTVLGCFLSLSAQASSCPQY